MTDRKSVLKIAQKEVSVNSRIIFLTESHQKKAIFNLLSLCFKVVAACVTYLRKLAYIYLYWNKKVLYLFHSVSPCSCTCKDTHSYRFRTEVRMFHCFDKANCHTGTVETIANLFSRSYYNNYQLVDYG